jgi:hypothetical protein
MSRDASPQRKSDSSDEYYTPGRGLLGMFGTRKLLKCTFCGDRAYVHSRSNFLNVSQCPGIGCKTCICEECGDDEWNYCKRCNEDYCDDCIDSEDHAKHNVPAVAKE